MHDADVEKERVVIMLDVEPQTMRVEVEALVASHLYGVYKYGRAVPEHVVVEEKVFSST